MPPQPSRATRNHPKTTQAGDIHVTLIDMVLQATELDVRRAVGQTMRMLADSNLAPDLLFTVEIVLAELLNNIVEHGYPDTTTGCIQLKIVLHTQLVEIETFDNGIQLPNLKAPNPPEPNLQVDRNDLPEGQFGWFMIRKLCRDLEYHRIGRNNQFLLRITTETG